MPADDIVAKTIPEIGVVVLTGEAPALGPENIVPVVNQLDLQSDKLRLQDRVKEAGPRIVFYEFEQGEDVTVCLAVPVAEPPADSPAPAHYRVLPEIEAAAAVRSGPAASIFPMVYHDLVHWIESTATITSRPRPRSVGPRGGRRRRRRPAGIRDPAAVHPHRRPGWQLRRLAAASGAAAAGIT